MEVWSTQITVDTLVIGSTNIPELVLFVILGLCHSLCGHIQDVKTQETGIHNHQFAEVITFKQIQVFPKLRFILLIL